MREVQGGGLNKYMNGDDSESMAGSREDLQEIADEFRNYCDRVGLKIKVDSSNGQEDLESEYREGERSGEGPE